MRIGIIGAGRIGGNLARLLGAAGHEVMVSFARDRARLEALAADIGERATAGTVADAARFGSVVVLSVPWTTIDDVLGQAGPLDGTMVIDTTNHFGPSGVEPLPEGMTAAQVNQARIPGADVVKAFNTLTAGFQTSAAGRRGAERVAVFYAGDDASANETAAGLIDDAGFVPVEVGGLAQASVMEAPRRPGSVYGEEYRHTDALAAVAAWRAGQPIPPTPGYEPFT